MLCSGRKQSVSGDDGLCDGLYRCFTADVCVCVCLGWRAWNTCAWHKPLWSRWQPSALKTEPEGRDVSWLQTLPRVQRRMSAVNVRTNPVARGRCLKNPAVPQQSQITAEHATLATMCSFITCLVLDILCKVEERWFNFICPHKAIFRKKNICIYIYIHSHMQWNAV